MDTEAGGSGPVLNGGGVAEKQEERMFTLKKWNAVAMWSWDVECDTCAICRVQVQSNRPVSAVLEAVSFCFTKHRILVLVFLILTINT